MDPADSGVEEAPDREQRVTPLELFFDLVFVLSITEITGYVSHHLSWAGLGRGLLLLALLWWAWGAYAWLTNAVDAESRLARVVVFAATGGMLVVALAVPHAFSGDGLTLAIAYGVVRLLHVWLYAISTRGQGQHDAVLSLAPYMVAGPALVVVGGAIGGDAQIAIWLVALAVDYLGPVLSFRRADGWDVAAGHFAERHGLIVIIALGESVVAIGVGGSHGHLTSGIVAAALLGALLVACIWWAYFDVVAVVAERKLHEVQGRERAKQARDSYSYLHLPMIAGIVLVALGIKQTIADVHGRLDTVAAVCLCGGLALYLLGHIAFRLRNVRTLNRQRLVTVFVLIAAVPAVEHVEALAALAIVSGIATALIAYEALRFAEARQRVRSAL